MKIALAILSLFLLTHLLYAQQVPDTSYTVQLKEPSYAAGAGPLVLVDGGHGNFHTLSGRFAAFGNVVRADGFRVASLEGPVTPRTLREAKILVIANALDKSNQENWSLPTPTAFSHREIETITEWVEQGGRLFLIADHMPFPGAIAELAAGFGVEWENNYAMDNLRRSTEIYSKGNEQLAEHPLTGIGAGYLPVDSVAVFTGSAFIPPAEAEIVMQVNEHYTLLSPQTAWQFTEATPHKSGEGYAQGATLVYGKGKVVVWGEAAMLSAQLAGPQQQFKMGMNAPAAKNNYKLLVNLVRWLDR